MNYLIHQLREYAVNNGYSHGDYADTMRQAADRIAELESRPAAPVVAEGFVWPEPPKGGQSDVLFDDGYTEGWAKAIDTVRKLLAAHPVAGSPADGAQTDLAKRLLEIADKTGGQHSAVSVLKADLIAICCEANRYYDGMLAWKKTAEKKDADWNAERMSRIDERCAARATATPVPASEAASVPYGWVLDAYGMATFERGVNNPWKFRAGAVPVFLAAPAAPTDTNQERADFENWYLTHIEGAELGSHDCATLWSAWLARSGGFYKAPRDWQIAPMPWSAPAAPTDAKPAEDILHEAQQRMWTALDRKACPGVWIQIASDAVLGFKKDSYGSDLPAAQSVRDAAQPTVDVCAEMRALCIACGGTGDVTRADGEYMGKCDCEASAQPTIAAEDVRDAARYRWMRKFGYQAYELVFHDDGTLKWGKDLDIAIDAAIATPTPPSKG